MIKSFMTSGLLLSLSMMIAGTAQAEEKEFIYKIKKYSPIGDCHDVADLIGRTFKERTKITPLESRCVDISAGGFDIEIAYLAVKELSLVTTAPAWRSLGVSAAAFATREDCKTNLPAEEAVFRGTTGLIPTVAYCYQEELTRQDPWVARIDAFGAAAVQPFLSGTSMLEVPVSTDLPGVRDGIVARLASRGIDTRFIKIRGSGLQGEVSILYYAPTAFRLELTEHVKVLKREQCDEQLELSRAIFAGAPSTPLSQYCASGLIGGTFYVMGFYQNASGLKQIDAPERYLTYADCMESREDVLADYKRRLGIKIQGALCSREKVGSFEETWRVRIISK